MTLLEIVLAMGVLSLVLVGVLQMFSLSLLSNQGSLSRTELTFKAQQVIENIIALLKHSTPQSSETS